MNDAHRFNPVRYKHWTEDQVRFSDLDVLGHVNNNAIGVYFENARAELYSAITPRWPWSNPLFVLVHSSVDFRQELHRPARLRIGTCVTALGRTSVRMAHALFHEERGVAYGENVSVLIDEATRQPIELPDVLRQIVQPFLDGTL